MSRITRPSSAGAAANRSIAAAASCMSVSEPRRSSDSANAAVVVWRYSATSAGVASGGVSAKVPAAGDLGKQVRVRGDVLLDGLRGLTGELFYIMSGAVVPVLAM